MIRKIKSTEPELYVWDKRFPSGRLEIPLENKKFTVINYYNDDPDRAIPVLHKPDTWYLHPTRPAYLIYFNNHQYVGTYEEIKALIE
jgi:hypothetical protein